MKFETLLETLELREFRGQYLPYVALHKQLLSVTTPPQRRLFRSLSSVSTRSEEAKQPQDADNPMKKWRETLQQEVNRIAGHIDVGLRELRIGLTALSKLSTTQEARGSSVDGAPFWEIRSLDAFDNLSEGVGRYRSFAEVNYAALIRLLQTYDEELHSDEGVNIHLPMMAEALGMERFEALEWDIKEAVRASSLLHGLEANPRVARMMAGLGTLRKSSLGSPEFDGSVFALGLVFGSCLAFFLMTIVLCVLPARQPATYNAAYFLAPLGLFRLTLSVPLVYWSMGTVTWVCDSKRINYMFLLGIDPRCQVSSSFFFKRAALLTSLWMLTLICYVLDYKFLLLPIGKYGEGPGVPRGSWHFFLYPLTTLIVTLLVELGPSRIFRYSYRWGIIKSLGRFVSSPWFFVVFADNLVGDIVTSLSRPLQDVAIASCYMGAHHPQTQEDLEYFASHQSHCGNWERIWFRPLITGGPLMLRALQCLRRFRDTRDIAHVQNCCKYCTAMCVILASRWGAGKWIVVGVSIAATVYASVWDVFKDWGLGPFELRRIYRTSRGDCLAPRPVVDQESGARQMPFLVSPTATAVAVSPRAWTRQTSVDLRSSAQQKRLFSASFYTCAIFFDMFARSTWAMNYLPITVISKDLNDQVTLFFYLVVVEITRRTLWVIIRLEWEQVSNASGFRALLWVPVRIQDSYRKPAASTASGVASPTHSAAGQANGRSIEMSSK
mmetsp:Transcript_57075/g.160153  ORF Transcript_57075/g.160153 Transcript_57075/m.160153 type:complete len:723 (+) Transcript_57075:43-2211(+)